MVRGSGQHLYDDHGDRYLDLYNNVAHIGHSHPAITAAATKQLSTLNTNTRYLSHQHIQLARELTSMLPHPLSVCYFVNSGSEANDLAIRLARAATVTATHVNGGTEVIVVDGAYHGNTSTLIDVSPYKYNGRGGSGHGPLHQSWVHEVSSPNCYRGRYGYDDPEAGVKYAAEVTRVVQSCQREGKQVAAFIVEAFNSGAGQVSSPICLMIYEEP